MSGRLCEARGRLARLVGALVTAAIVVIGPHCAESAAAMTTPPVEPAAAPVVVGEAAVSARWSAPVEATLPLLRMAASGYDSTGEQNDLLSICLSFLISVVLVASAVITLRLVRSPGSAGTWTARFAVPRRAWSPRLDPDAIGISRT